MSRSIVLILLCFLLVFVVNSSILENEEEIGTEDSDLVEQDLLTDFIVALLKTENDDRGLLLLERLMTYEDPKQISCKKCRLIVDVILRTLEKPVVRKVLCLFLTDLDPTVKSKCMDFVNINYDIIMHVLNSTSEVTSERICGIMAPHYGCPQNNFFNWTIVLPPPETEENRKLPEKEKQEKPLKILHLTDVHYDELYKVGANAYCLDTVCCGAGQGTPKYKEAMAGVWGHYECDMPWNAIENLMQHISTQNIDFVYFTGDIISHRVWSTSKEQNSQAIRKFYRKLKEAFGSTVFSVLGNHESHPVNQFETTKNINNSELSTQWLYDLFAEETKDSLPSSAHETIRRGGFYTVEVKPGFRIIALNNNVAARFNWWLIYQEEELIHQLQMLVHWLQMAERNGEFVHILAHIPSNSIDLYTKFSQEYLRIVNRFSHVIAAQFVGHSHSDELHFQFNKSEDEIPVSIAFNGGSFSPFQDRNPNYKIYHVNPHNGEVLDSETWVYNLTAANMAELNKTPDWYQLYSFKNTYKMQSMNMAEMGNFVANLSNKIDYLEKYLRYKGRDGDSYLRKGCDQQCYENMCDLVVSENGQHNWKCAELRLTLSSFKAEMALAELQEAESRARVKRCEKENKSKDSKGNSDKYLAGFYVPETLEELRNRMGRRIADPFDIMDIITMQTPRPRQTKHEKVKVPSEKINEDRDFIAEYADFLEKQLRMTALNKKRRIESHREQSTIPTYKQLKFSDLFKDYIANINEDILMKQLKQLRTDVSKKHRRMETNKDHGASSQQKQASASEITVKQARTEKNMGDKHTTTDKTEKFGRTKSDDRTCYMCNREQTTRRSNQNSHGRNQNNASKKQNGGRASQNRVRSTKDYDLGGFRLFKIPIITENLRHTTNLNRKNNPFNKYGSRTTSTTTDATPEQYQFLLFDKLF